MPIWEGNRRLIRALGGPVFFSHPCFSCCYEESLLNQAASCCLIYLVRYYNAAPSRPKVVWATGIPAGRWPHPLLPIGTRVLQGSLHRLSRCSWRAFPVSLWLLRKSFLLTTPCAMTVYLWIKLLQEKQQERYFNSVILNTESPGEHYIMLLPRPGLLRSRYNWATCKNVSR